MNDSNIGNQRARQLQRQLVLRQAIAYLSHCDNDLKSNPIFMYGKPLITLAFPSNDRAMHEVFLEDYLTDSEFVGVLLNIKDKLLPRLEALEASHE